MVSFKEVDRLLSRAQDPHPCHPGFKTDAENATKSVRDSCFIEDIHREDKPSHARKISSGQLPDLRVILACSQQR